MDPVKRGPSKCAEAVVAFLLPRSCREEVLGDLYERYKSPLQYAADAVFTVPLVIASRIRRNSDPQIVLIEVLTMYLAYWAATWYVDRSFMWTESAFLFLAIPAVATMVLFALWDAYDASRRKPILCATLGALFAFVTGAVPLEILVGGVLMIAALVLTIRVMFPRYSNWPQPVTAARVIDPQSLAIVALLWLLYRFRKRN